MSFQKAGQFGRKRILSGYAWFYQLLRQEILTMCQNQGWADEKVQTVIEQYDRPQLNIRGRFKSKFATTEDELDIVLALRRAFFGDNVIVPDGVYRTLWEKNKYSMKVVYDGAGAPIGYWSVAPVDEKSFKFFIGVDKKDEDRPNRERSHQDMLENGSRGWGYKPGEKCYLYIVGAVEPLRARRPNATFLSERIVTDAFQFALEIYPELDVKGICGYATRSNGRNILEGRKRLNLAPSSVDIQGDTLQNVLYADGDKINHVMENLSFSINHLAYRETATGRIIGRRHNLPVWDKYDKVCFFKQLKRQ
jgi:hypothetical protein